MRHINKHGGSSYSLCVSKLVCVSKESRGEQKKKRNHNTVWCPHPKGATHFVIVFPHCHVRERERETNYAIFSDFITLPSLSDRLYLIVSVSPHLRFFSSSIFFYVAVSWQRRRGTMWIYPCASLPIGLLVTRQLLGRRNTRSARVAGCFRLGFLRSSFFRECANKPTMHVWCIFNDPNTNCRE